VLAQTARMYTSIGMPKRREKTEEAKQEFTVQVKIVARPDTPSYYVNYIGVSHTPYEFTLSVTKVPSPVSEEQMELVKAGKPLPLEAILQLVVPPLLVDGLIKALADQKQKYEETLKKQVKNNELQQYGKPSGPIQ
jgi:hypothetical protein